MMIIIITTMASWPW